MNVAKILIAPILSYIEALALIIIGGLVGFVNSILVGEISLQGLFETFVYSGVGAVAALMIGGLWKVMKKKLFKMK
jgi:uncharacterized membrane protein YeaQ/YmgE (transglycosylase-associated protein family)